MGKLPLVFLILVLLPFCLGFTLTSNIADTNTSAEELTITWATSDLDENYTQAEAHFKLNVNNVNQIDSTGNNHNGTVSGATFTSIGKYGSAYNFTTASSHINFGDIDLINFTILGWEKPTVRQTQILFSRHGFTSYYAEDRSNGLKCCVVTAGGETCSIHAYVCPLNTWCFFQCKYDGVNICSSFNTQTWTCTAKTGNPSASDQPFLIGNGMTSGGEPLNGTLDDIRVYSQALTDEQIQDIYLLGSLSMLTSCLLKTDSTTVDTVSPYTWDTSDYLENEITLNLTCYDGATYQSDSGLYRFNFFTATYLAYKNWKESEDIREGIELIAFVVLWLGLWIFGYYAVQTGNMLLGGTMIVLTTPINLFFSYKFQESLMLGTGFLGIGFALMSAWTFGVFVLIKRTVRH